MVDYLDALRLQVLTGNFHMLSSKTVSIGRPSCAAGGRLRVLG